MSDPKPTPEDVKRADEACVLSVFTAVREGEDGEVIPRRDFLAREFARVRAEEREACEESAEDHRLDCPHCCGGCEKAIRARGAS